MRVFQALLGIAGILIIGGVYVLVPPIPSSHSSSATIPAGTYFERLTFDIVKSGHISGAFSDTSGNGINLYIFDTGQLNAYTSSTSFASLYRTSGTSGSFSASFIEPGTYYLVIEHSTSTAAQTVQLTYQLDGMNPFILVTGAGLLFAGVILALVGRRSRRKSEPPPKHSDVVMFDQPKP